MYQFFKTNPTMIAVLNALFANPVDSGLEGIELVFTGVSPASKHEVLVSCGNRVILSLIFHSEHIKTLRLFGAGNARCLIGCDLIRCAAQQP